MQVRFIGGPHDGLQMDRAAVYQHCVVRRISTADGDSLFVFMPPTREQAEQLARGEGPHGPARDALASWLPYYHVAVDGREEFHFDEGGQRLSTRFQRPRRKSRR